MQEVAEEIKKVHDRGNSILLAGMVEVVQIVYILPESYLVLIQKRSKTFSGNLFAI